MSFFHNQFIRQLLSSSRDLSTIFAVVLVFQLFVVKQPIPNVVDLLGGAVLVVL